MIKREDCLLLIVDVQERLVCALDKDVAVKKTAAMAKAAQMLDIPVIATEQYPQGLGATVDVVKENFSPNTPIISKTTFSALGTEGFLQILRGFDKKQILICGIETHVCVHQTAADLISKGFEVFVIKDACASRNKYEFKQGIECMKENGARIYCVEIALFELLGDSKDPHFKQIQALVK